MHSPTDIASGFASRSVQSDESEIVDIQRSAKSPPGAAAGSGGTSAAGR